ncbi:MAG: DNA mismatch repair endonuclease MutL [Planctomycetes bacterium]|nr:DNA mismatch repair endonuclease MutL [Planctomycetota bacterium]
MGRIRLLSPELANQIAAGEVIERPASVVKELVENSLDAGATRIDVALVDAGKTLIRVSDNGEGIAAEDLPLAIAAHATSKLREAADLFQIITNGFRGEALASIGAVSRLKVVSRQVGDEHAHEISISGGDATPVRACAAAPGTSIEVRDLFHNIPARRKWLKGDGTEFSHIIELMQVAALAHPEIGFSLRHGERVALEASPGEDTPTRLRSLFADSFAEGVLEAHEFEPYAKLDAYFAPPSTNRPNTRGLQLFVNRRPIRDRALMQAVMLAFREFLPPGRFPVAFVFLTVDPSTVDVNVHPAKTEVRFLDQNRLFSLIKAALTEKLIGSGLLPSMQLPAQPVNRLAAFAPPPQARPDSPFEPGFDFAAKPEMFNTQQRTDAREAWARWDAAREVLAGPSAVTEREALASGKTEGGRQEAGVAVEVAATNPQSTIQNPQSLLSRARGLFQVGNTYIVVETDDGMVVIDQHAYHERILFHQVESRFGEVAERQRLIAPMPLNLSKAAVQVALSQREALAEFGFEVEPFGPDSLALTTVPKFSKDRHAETVQALCEELAQGRRPANIGEARKQLTEMIACKAAIKAGYALTPQQIRDLLKLGESVPHTYACPHGRPTTYKIGFIDLEKVFHRR